MRVMLTSCGLETQKIKDCFLTMLGKEGAKAKALFIPTAAIDADAIEVLPKCMNDLLKCGIPKENIRVFDLHQNMPMDELKTYDVVYLTGGRTSYLLERINDTGFRETLLTYIRDNGFVIGVSAGSGNAADLYQRQRFCDWRQCGKHYFCQQFAGESGAAGYEAGCSLRSEQLYGQSIFPADGEYEAVEHSGHNLPQHTRRSGNH